MLKQRAVDKTVGLYLNSEVWGLGNFLGMVLSTLTNLRASTVTSFALFANSDLGFDIHRLLSTALI